MHPKLVERLEVELKYKAEKRLLKLVSALCRVLDVSGKL